MRSVCNDGYASSGMAAAERRTNRVGVISDTHGLVRPEAIEALRGCECIVHAGDVGGSEVLDALARLAPVHAIRGNNDTERWARALPEERVVEVGGVRIYVIHALQNLAVDPVARRFAVVVAGHSHRPSIERRDGVLYVNPGSAGPRRFRLPVAVAILDVRDGVAGANVVTLSI